MNRLLTLALMVSLPVFCETLSSDEPTSSLSLGVTDHLIYSNAKDPLEKETQASGIFLNEFQVKAEEGNAGAAVQISNRYSPQLENDRTRYFALEKKTLSWDGEAWSLRAGDSHQELGRGIALTSGV